MVHMDTRLICFKSLLIILYPFLSALWHFHMYNAKKKLAVDIIVQLSLAGLMHVPIKMILQQKSKPNIHPLYTTYDIQIQSKNYVKSKPSETFCYLQNYSIQKLSSHPCVQKYICNYHYLSQLLLKSMSTNPGTKTAYHPVVQNIHPNHFNEFTCGPFSKFLVQSAHTHFNKLIIVLTISTDNEHQLFQGTLSRRISEQGTGIIAPNFADNEGACC